ncbi:MAG: transglycosylase SLT domain-containing protein [Bacteroidota bacterium]
MLPAINSDAWLERQVDLIYAAVDDEVAERLASMDQSIIAHRGEASVRRIISLYVERWRSGSEVILGRTARYFPRFEAELAQRGMPESIKYLTITESALRPWAVSHVGAAGFWQLMPGTAMELGLRVDSILDERLDFQLGTEAGLDYLEIQFERYGDWALALAAYNSGPGRVNRAIRRSGSRDFWRLQRYLPRETRSYVPGYIAAVYLAAFFHEHELEPRRQNLDLVLHEAVEVQGFISLHRVAQLTRLRPAEVLELNPAYLMGYVPADGRSHYLYLPSRVVPAFRTYLVELGPDRAEEDFHPPWLSPQLDQGELNHEQYYKRYAHYLMDQDSSFAQLEALLEVPAAQLQVWNYRGSMDSLEAGAFIDFYRVGTYANFGPPRLAVYAPWPELEERPFEPLMVRRKTPQPVIVAESLFVRDKPRRGLFRQIGGIFSRQN